jgi:hypothetical protein
MVISCPIFSKIVPHLPKLFIIKLQITGLQ